MKLWYKDDVMCCDDISNDIKMHVILDMSTWYKDDVMCCDDISDDISDDIKMCYVENTETEAWLDA